MSKGFRVSGLPDPASTANGEYIRYSATPELNSRPVFVQTSAGGAPKNYLYHDGQSWTLGPEIGAPARHPRSFAPPPARPPATRAALTARRAAQRESSAVSMPSRTRERRYRRT